MLDEFDYLENADQGIQPDSGKTQKFEVVQETLEPRFPNNDEIVSDVYMNTLTKHPTAQKSVLPLSLDGSTVTERIDNRYGNL